MGLSMDAVIAESSAEIDERSSAAASEQERLNYLLAIQNQVLGLIAAGSGLAICLEEIAGGLAALSENADYLIASADPESHEITVAASGALTCAIVDDDNTVDCFVPETLADRCCAALASQGRTPVSRRPISSHGDQVLGVLIIVDRGSSTPIVEVDQQAFDSMILLSSYAIESVRRTRALIAANERFSALAKSIPGVVYQRVVRPNGDIRYTYISDAAQDLFGVSPDEILSNPQALFDCHGPEYYATFRERLLTASRALKLWDVEATIITRDGTRKYTHAIARPHREADGSVIWNGVILDQTRIKEAELEAAAASARTRDAIIESIPQAFALYGPDERLVTWNKRFLDLYPELRDQLVAGTTYVELLRSEIEHGIDPLAETMTIQARLYERLAQHHLANHVIERQLPNGRWILINEHRTADGGTVALHTDISDLKDREEALERSNRELEAFASIASHDLQEPLRKVDAFGDRLKRKYHDDLGADGKMYIDRMQNSVGRMRSLINDLLDYSRVTTKAKPFASIGLQEIVSDVVSDLEVRIESANGKVDIAELPTLDADPTQMRQLFQNLIANALKFHRPDISPVVRIEAHIINQADKLGPQRCRIEVIDNGIGFDMKYAERIFGIFQRLHTKAEYEGTGVGLATCRKIVERHRGSINVLSRAGEGTTFTIDLPLNQPNTEASGEAS